MKKAFLGNIEEEKFEFPLEALKKHFIALGSSGSGKTVLCKVIMEEAARNKIPAIILDPQGDLASLAILGKDTEKQGITKDMQDSYTKNTKITIFTPCSSKGVPICINPLKVPKEKIEKEELINIIQQVANATANLLGYRDDDRGHAAQSIIYFVLLDSYETKKDIKSFSNLANIIENLPEKIKEKAREFTSSSRDIKELVRKIKYLTIGGKNLLFQFGIPLNIETLLKNKENKTQISIIYLNTLRSEKEKHFFLAMLSTSLYQWMLSNPSKNLQALYYIDEIAEYIPAGAKKPVTKEILQLIFKQARKYGVGCVISTQNPGDIDYKAFAQFGTWAVGRLTTKQDRDKIKDALKSLAGSQINTIIDELPKLQPSEFIFFSPDVLKDIKKLKSRYLITKHTTLTENDVKKIIPESIRNKFKHIEEQPEENKPTEKTMPHLHIGIRSKQLNRIVESKKKRALIVLGPKNESIEEIKLFFKPIIMTKIRQMKRGLIKKTIEEHIVLFDGINGDLLRFKNNSLKNLDGFSHLLGLTDDEITIIRILSKSTRDLTSSDIAATLGLTESLVKKTVTNLMKKKIVSYSGKAGKTHLWNSLIKINIPEIVSKVSSPELTISEEPEDAEIIKEKVNIDQLSDAVRSYFKSSNIVEHYTIYYPFYQIKLNDKNKIRVLNISAVSGKVID